MKDYYGTIYPDLLKFRFDSDNDGKVFHARINTLGGLARQKQFTADQSAWEDCQKCELFGSCYDLSTASYIAQSGLRTFGSYS